MLQITSFPSKIVLGKIGKKTFISWLCVHFVHICIQPRLDTLALMRFSFNSSLWTVPLTDISLLKNCFISAYSLTAYCSPVLFRVLLTYAFFSLILKINRIEKKKNNLCCYFKTTSQNSELFWVIGSKCPPFSTHFLKCHLKNFKYSPNIIYQCLFIL